MKLFKHNYLLIVMIFAATTFFTGCKEANSRIEEELDNLNKRAVELDSAVNKGLDKVEDLDSTITAKSRKIRNLDSIARKTSTRIDSIINKSTEEINRQLN